MSSFIIYIIKVSVYLAGFYLVYRILLSNDTLYSRNRAYILVSVISSFILPFITIGIINPILPSFNKVLSEILVDGSGVNINPAGRESFSVTPVSMVRYVYLAGLMIFVLKLIIDAMDLAILILRHRRNETNIVRFNGFNTAGFSAFGYIFIDRNLSDDEAEEIIKHEQNHLNHFHSADIFFFEIVKAFLWFNPVIYMYGRLLRAVHEYQADEECLTLGISVKNYQKLLMNQIFRSKVFTISNSFSNPSLIKKRMIMMTRKRSRAMANIKLLMVLPVIAGLMIFISSCSQNSKQADAPKMEAAPPPPPPPAPAADEAEGDVPFELVDVMPVFKGGEDALIKYIAGAVVYPENAKEKGIQGRVIVRFAIEADGRVGRVKILKGVDPELDKEAFRVVSEMPSFEKPGVKDGKNVSVWYTVPINFKLQ
jgi:TonB family protein